jgi:hypothetical protein
MCDKCAELDGKIEHYRRLAQWVTDRKTLDGIASLILKYQEDKRALHRNQE